MSDKPISVRKTTYESYECGDIVFEVASGCGSVLIQPISGGLRMTVSANSIIAMAETLKALREKKP